jgi:hypothetical protein
MKTNTLPHPSFETPAFPEAEALTEERQRTAEALGHLAVNGQLSELPDDYINNGLQELETHANSHPTETEAQTETDTRIHDIEAAHEAALLENKIFDAHVAALKENEIRDAYEAAQQEDKERTEAKAQQLEQAREQKEQQATTDTATESEQATKALAPSSPAELRKEATLALEEAGLTGLAAQVYAGSEVQRDLAGKLTIVDGTSARVITRIPGSKPQVTEYAYDKNNGTVTVTSGTSTLTGHIAKYAPTEEKQWQTRDKIITLPPNLARRFGIERAVVIK